MNTHQQLQLRVMTFFFFVAIISWSCNDPRTEVQSSSTKSRPDKFTDINGALEWEFNLLKNPATGKIPEGIREAELSQAASILMNQPNSILTNSYTFQGPDNLGGRTRALVYDVRYDGVTNFTIWAAGVSGAVYKSIDDGATWTRISPVSDLMSVTALVQDPRAPFRDTWYYAGGEWTGNSASATGGLYRGKGVFKSTDNGATWTHLASSNTGVYESFDHRADYVTKLVVDPTNGNVYMATMDGIYRSTDGGVTWGLVLYSGAAGGYSSGMPTDIVVTSTGRFYASFSGGNTAAPTNMPGVWTSTTGASLSWTKIAGATSGTSPAGWNANGTYGRVVLAYAPSLDSRVYALYTISVGACSVEAEMFYWDDGSSTWTEISATLPDEPGCLSGNDPFAVQGGYDLVVGVKPDDEDVVYIGGTNIYRSEDAGLTWTRIGGYASPASYALYASSHPDIHSITFHPLTSTTMLCGNDGGIQRTTDNLAGSVSWSQINIGYRTYQYYYVDIDPRIANSKVIGGAQDNGSTRNIGGSGVDFEMVWGGDGVSVGLNDPAATAGTQYEYVGSQLGFINRRASTAALGTSTGITPVGEGGTGLFVTLFKLDADNSEFLYYANDDKIYRTISGSTVTTATWTDMTGISATVTTTITALALSRGGYSAATSSLFFGTSGGKVYRLDNPALVGSATPPVDLTPGGTSFPGAVGGYVSSIAVNPRNDDTVLVTFSNYGLTSVFWTGDANSATPTWTAVEGSLTLPSFRSSAIHAIPNSPEVHYFVGTSVGLYRVVGLPGVTTWSQEGTSEIGNAVISSLAFRVIDANLLVGTHGGGMYKTALSLVSLPVELTQFTGALQANRSVLLKWNTSSEQNSKHFELEKSFDGYNYNRIAVIDAAGQSAVPRNYSYVDRGALSDRNFYRLKSVDIDGRSSMSNVVLVRVTSPQLNIVVTPNPFKQSISVVFSKIPGTTVEMKLFDATGRLVTTRKVKASSVVSFDTAPHKLNKGIYHLSIIVDGQVFVRKLIHE